MGACEARPEGYQDPFVEDDEDAAQRALQEETDPTLYNERAYDERGWCCFEDAVSDELLARLAA